MNPKLRSCMYNCTLRSTVILASTAKQTRRSSLITVLIKMYLQSIAMLAFTVVTVTVLPLAVSITVFTAFPEVGYRCTQNGSHMMVIIK